MTSEERYAVILQEGILDAIRKPSYQSWRTLELTAEYLSDRVHYSDDEYQASPEAALILAHVAYLEALIATRKAKYAALYGPPKETSV